MAFANNITIAASATARGSMATILTTAGFTRVTQDYAASATLTIDVWKSPAASNAAGVDWYLLLGDDLSAGNRSMRISVAEGWDDATKMVTRYIPVNPNQTPAGDFSIGATAVAPTIANVMYMPSSTWVNTAGLAGFSTVTATPDRVIWRLADGQCHYIGQLDRTYPVAIDPAPPLGVISLLGSSSANTVNQGGCTREPNQTVANAFNWRAYLWSNNWRLLNAATDSILGKPFSTPVIAACSRFYSSSWRGIFKDLRGSLAPAALGDVMTETLPDGSTKSYWYLTSPGASYGVWAPSI